VSEERARALSLILAGILTASAVIFCVVAGRTMRESLGAHKEFLAGMTERADHAMWAAEVAAADDAPGEGI
jgi:hypothetical protein